MKIEENYQELFDSSLEMMKDVINTSRGAKIAKDHAKHGGNEEGASSGGTSMVVTGNTKLKHMKRKKAFYEKK